MSLPHPDWSDPITENGPEPMLAWLSDQFHDLADEGQEVVNRYWQELRMLENSHSSYQRSTLGLRMRLRENLAVSLEWYLMGTLGRSKKPVAKVHIAKGRTHDAYSLKVLMRRQPVWLTDHVDGIEKELTQIRMRQTRLIRIRDALGDLLKITTGSHATGSQLMAHYIARESYRPLSGGEAH